MFQFATGIKSLSNFDPTIELEEAKDPAPPVARNPFFSSQPTQYPQKQAFLYNEAIAAAAQLRGIFCVFLMSTILFFYFFQMVVFIVMDHRHMVKLFRKQVQECSHVSMTSLHVRDEAQM